MHIPDVQMDFVFFKKRPKSFTKQTCFCLCFVFQKRNMVAKPDEANSSACDMQVGW